MEESKHGTGAALATPAGAADVLTRYRPGLTVIEAPLPTGGAWAGTMHAQNMVRGGWAWICAIHDVPVVLLPPGVWQPAICGAQRGKGSYKKAYKAHARALLGRAVNEDAAAALCMLEFALRALGHELPAEILSGPVSASPAESLPRPSRILRRG